MDISGQSIKGYELQELIGEGGFGAVYRAYQPVVKRDVALKIILPEYANNPEFIRKFEAEAQMVARLEHLNIVPLYDYWREPGKAYLVMRWLRGGSLAALLKQQGFLPAETIIRLVDQLGGALAQAHRHGVVHRDLKPANVLLDEDQNAYLSDFGLAISLKGDNETADQIAGTPHYMAPEQITGEEVSPQTDIYAFGIMLYELLTGSRPYEGTLSELILGHLQDPLPSLTAKKADLSPQLDAVVQRASAKAPAERYPDVRSMVVAFKQAMATSTFGTSPGELQASVSYTPTSSRTGLVHPMYRFDLDLAVENPYKGLRAFEEGDAADFFGREVLVGRLLNRLSESRFLAVVGPSGSGKSSVVKAGVLPALRQGKLPNSQNWFIMDLVPGNHPLEKLQSALLGIAVHSLDLGARLRKDERGLVEIMRDVLPNDGSELLLVIDQFEEVFTQVTDERERVHFLESLRLAISDPSSRLRVIVTLRADFYDRPLLYPLFGELVRQHTEVVLPLSPEELEQAIVGPAERVGLSIEPTLIAAIVADVNEEPGALPLLQYALTELFEKRQGMTLTLEAYRNSGGVLGALARRAEELYLSLDDKQQEMARQLFLRLVTLGEGVEDTRRRVLWGEILNVVSDHDLMQSVIDTYGKYRLLTFDNDPQTREPTIEVAHEAIIRQWKRLREWLDASRQDLRLQRMLNAGVQEWLHSGRDTSFLLRGTRLHQFEEWAANTQLALSQDERAYIDASLKERQRQQEEAEAQAAYQRRLEQRARRVLQWLAAVMLVGLVVAAALSIVAFNQRSQAQENADRAEASAIRSDSLRYGAEANTLLQNQSDNELATLLSIYALDLAYAPQADKVLSEAAYLDFPVRYFAGHTQQVYSVRFSADGKSLLTSALDKSIRLWDVSSGEEVQRFKDELEFGIWESEFSADETLILALFGGAGGIRVWDRETGAEIFALATEEDDPNTYYTAELSPDGRWVAAGRYKGSIELWDIERNEMIRTLEGFDKTVQALKFSPDGRYILAAGDNSVAVLWDTQTGEEIRRYEGHANTIYTVNFSQDGSRILTSSWDGTARLWETETGKELVKFSGHTGPIWGSALSSDGHYVVTGGDDFSARLWDAETGAELRRFTGHTNIVYAVAFSPDSRYVVTGGWDNQIKLWEVEPSIQPHIFKGHTDLIYDVAMTADNKTFFSGSVDGTIRMWDAATGEVIREFSGHEGGINGVALSPDERWLASTSDDATARLWDVTTGEELRVFETEAITWMTMVVFSPDGRYILTGTDDDAVYLWDVETGEVLRRYTGHEADIWAIAISPDGRYVVAGSYDSTARIWDAETGEELHLLTAHGDTVWTVAFSPDSRSLVTADDDGAVILWEVQSGKEIRRFSGHNSSVYAVGFSPDGKVLLSGSGDSTIRLWDIQTGREIRRLTGHNGAVNIVRFSPDGYWILSGSSDNTVRLWYTQVEDLIGFACSRLVRDFTETERSQYAITRQEPLCAK
jgi:WD40 repeat protein/serine/threonine protein kinase